MRHFLTDDNFIRSRGMNAMGHYVWRPALHLDSVNSRDHEGILGEKTGEVKQKGPWVSGSGVQTCSHSRGKLFKDKLMSNKVTNPK